MVLQAKWNHCTCGVMTSISTSFTATGLSDTFTLVFEQTATYSITGGFVATLSLERTGNGGQSWETLFTTTAEITSAIIRDQGTYRFRCSAYTSGTAVAAMADNIDTIDFPVIKNLAGEVCLDVTDEGVATKSARLSNDIWIIGGLGAPADGTSGTGAGVTGKGSVYASSTGGSLYVNTGTKASPTWTIVEAGVGAVTNVTANGGLASSGGATPNISITNANLIGVRDNGNITGNAATATTATSATTATTATNATNFTGNLAGQVTGPMGTTVVAFVGATAGATVETGVAAANAAVSAPTVSTIVKRDAAGRAQFVNPVAAQDAATKSYVDSVAVGLTVHTPAAVASTANLTLSGEQTIDGVLTSATRILVKNQTAPAENGIYVTAAGAWARATDMDVWSEVPGSFVFVTGGTTQASSGWANTSPLSGTIDVTAMTWAQFSQAGTYLAGTGLLLTGSTFSVIYGTTSGTSAQGNDSRITGALQAASNLSDVASAATAVNNLGGASSTGTGGLVRASSPTLVTPNIGTATGSVSGNAGTATVLATARNINGVSFNGSASITVPAAGSTLTDAVPLTGLAAQAAHTFVANATAGSAAPTAISLTTAASELADWKAQLFANFLASVVVDTGTTLTLSATQRGTVLTMNNASAITLTLHATAEIGYSVTVYQKGAGQITFAAASGATLRNRASQTKSAGQYALCTLICESNAGGSAAIWVLAGDTGT